MEGDQRSYGDSSLQEEGYFVHDYTFGAVFTIDDANNVASLWHCRLGHMSQKRRN